MGKFPKNWAINNNTSVKKNEYIKINSQISIIITVTAHWQEGKVPQFIHLRQVPKICFDAKQITKTKITSNHIFPYSRPIKKAVTLFYAYTYEERGSISL